MATNTDPRYSPCIRRPATARWPHSTGLRGQGARQSAAAASRQPAVSAKRSARKVMGSACGMLSRAPMKPVLHSSTNTGGSSRSGRPLTAAAATAAAS